MNKKLPPPIENTPFQDSMIEDEFNPYELEGRRLVFCLYFQLCLIYSSKQHIVGIKKVWMKKFWKIND